MDWSAAVDIYCERTSAAFWAEPLNAVSNLAFPLAALWAAVQAKRCHIAAPVVWLLIGMAALIGLGSFLFHTFANAWSEYADTVPIWSFVALYIFTAIHRLGGVKPGRLAAIALAVAGLLSVIFLAAGEGRTAPDPLNGSGQYAPALIALVVFAALARRRHHPMRAWIAACALTFLISLVFRTVDKTACTVLPFGTHFLWHILNAGMVGLLLQVLIRSPVKAAAPSA